MKNKKFLYTLLVLVLVLAMGIGYAALSKNLILTGGVSTNKTGSAEDDYTTLEENFNVHFNDAVTNAYTTGNTQVSVTFEDSLLQATIGVKELGTLNEQVVIPFEIINESEDLKAKIKVSYAGMMQDPEDGTNFDHTYFDAYITDSNGNKWECCDAEGTIKELTTLDEDGGTVQFYLVVKLVKSPIEHKTASFEVHILAEAIES